MLNSLTTRTVFFLSSSFHSLSLITILYPSALIPTTNLCLFHPLFLFLSPANPYPRNPFFSVAHFGEQPGIIRPRCDVDSGLSSSFFSSSSSSSHSALPPFLYLIALPLSTRLISSERFYQLWRRPSFDSLPRDLLLQGWVDAECVSPTSTNLKITFFFFSGGSVCGGMKKKYVSSLSIRIHLLYLFCLGLEVRLVDPFRNA